MGTTIGKKKKDFNKAIIPAGIIFLISNFILNLETQTSLILSGLIGLVIWFNQ